MAMPYPKKDLPPMVDAFDDATIILGRRHRAMSAIQGYIEACDDSEGNEEVGTILCDCIADLLHFASVFGDEDPHTITLRALEHYEIEHEERGS